jgi:type IV pilus assembly protein PilM
VTNPFRVFGPGSAVTLRPRLACEILPEGIVAARQEGASDESALTSFAALPANALAPGLAAPNLTNRAAVVAGMRKALDELAPRDRQITLVVPDAAVRVLLLDFDTLPPKSADVLPMIRFRLRKLVPFEVETASISYQRMGSEDAGLVRLLVVVMPHEVLAEYEAAVREAGYEPGAVLSSSLAAVAAVTSNDPALVVNRNGNTVTTAITLPGDLLLHRTQELPASEQETLTELQRTVSVAMAYFEDTLHARPQSLFYAGPGGAAAFEPVLAEETLRVRELVPTPSTGSSAAMPKGLLSGVVGALAN